MAEAVQVVIAVSKMVYGVAVSVPDTPAIVPLQLSPA